MKSLFLFLFIFVSTTSYARDFEANLGSCLEQYEDVILEAKNDFLTTSIWNYDKDFSIDDVMTSKPYNFTSNDSFSVDIFFNIKGLEDFSYTYIIAVSFADPIRSVCDEVTVSDLIEN